MSETCPACGEPAGGAVETCETCQIVELEHENAVLNARCAGLEANCRDGAAAYKALQEQCKRLGAAVVKQNAALMAARLRIDELERLDKIAIAAAIEQRAELYTRRVRIEELEEELDRTIAKMKELGSLIAAVRERFDL
jgi:chromosome segregation ATPase